jgi:hypothetical protein
LILVIHCLLFIQYSNLLFTIFVQFPNYFLQLTLFYLLIKDLLLRRDFEESQLLSPRYSDFGNLFIEDFPLKNYFIGYLPPIQELIIHFDLFPS